MLVTLYPPALGGVLDGFSNGEGENPLLFSRNGGGGASRARFPPGPHLRGSRFSRLRLVAPTHFLSQNGHQEL